LLKAYTRLKRKLGTVMPLVLAGGKGWLADIDTLIDDLGLKDDVVVAGYLDDLDLQWLYQNCFAVLYPTLFEGFGLPVLEAMSQGAAVITSDATSIPEIAGDAALLVNPYREEDLCAAMLQLATNRTLREQLQARAQNQARRFQWKATAQIALRTYEEAIRTPRLREVLVQRGEAKPAARGLRLFAEPARAG
jgi:glycosyltransferase involved in cell wall biosynthesis